MSRFLPFRQSAKKDRVRATPPVLINHLATVVVDSDEEEFTVSMENHQEDDLSEHENVEMADEVQVSALAVVEPEVVPPINIIPAGVYKHLLLMDPEHHCEENEEQVYSDMLDDMGLDLNFTIMTVYQ
ncbi:hypothetical protein AMTR_s00053p00050680 [Amborella trichopoda]|uniref:Uncharacterized protein n=1 Tax=Amborella trichopoda TaxID=13333 RepID=W1PBE3_AMBTC|nr:hypothetical protein AMTR_s00053p00050680 [Amborella trichopoda]